MTAAPARPKQVLVSADGAFIHLTNGEWREVKTMVLGEFESVWNSKKGEIEVNTRDISHFSRSYRIREFERYALAELHWRGVDNAEEVVTVNDGSEWIQSFADYHIPQAVRILDFRHALDYVVAAGQAVYGEIVTPSGAGISHCPINSNNTVGVDDCRIVFTEHQSRIGLRTRRP